MENNELLLKRKKMMEKRLQMLKDMDIESIIPVASTVKKEKKKRTPAVVDESKRRKSRRVQGLGPELDISHLPMVEGIPEIEDRAAKEYAPAEINVNYDDFQIPGITFPIRVDGCYHGWISEDVCKKYGFPSEIPNKDELPPNMNSNSRKRSLSTSSAKEQSRLSFRSNPNQYFYRHVEPEEKQWYGNWIEEEIKLFCITASKYGCGDKWGLFSSFIPHRVGYQCSNFYREFILPRRLVIDPNYTVTATGEAVFHKKK